MDFIILLNILYKTDGLCIKQMLNQDKNFLGKNLHVGPYLHHNYFLIDYTMDRISLPG